MLSGPGVGNSGDGKDHAGWRVEITRSLCHLTSVHIAQHSTALTSCRTTLRLAMSFIHHCKGPYITLSSSMLTSFTRYLTYITRLEREQVSRTGNGKEANEASTL